MLGRACTSAASSCGTDACRFTRQLVCVGFSASHDQARTLDAQDEPLQPLLAAMLDGQHTSGLSLIVITQLVGKDAQMLSGSHVISLALIYLLKVTNC
jgi:hypothetical protein